MQPLQILKIGLICFALLWESAARLRLLPISPLSTLIVDSIRNFSPLDDTPDLPKIFAGHAFGDSSMIRRGVGTGVLIRSDGLILTNAHVVKGCNKLVASNQNGSVQATLVKVSERADVALLRLSLQIPRHSVKAFFTLADPIPAERVKVFGFPLADLIGSSGAFSDGIVNTDDVRDPTLFQFSAQVHSGNSGSAIVNGRGELVGLVTSKLDEIKFAQKTGEFVQGVNFGVKASALADLLPTLVVEPRQTGAIEQIKKWFSPRDEQVARSLNYFSVRVDCLNAASFANTAVYLPPSDLTRPPREGTLSQSSSPSGPAQPRVVEARKKKWTNMKIVTIESFGPLRFFFVHNGGEEGVFTINIGYTFSGTGKCSNDASIYDGIASVTHYIDAGVTERVMSDNIPEKARGFCVVNRLQ